MLEGPIEAACRSKLNRSPTSAAPGVGAPDSAVVAKYAGARCPVAKFAGASHAGATHEIVRDRYARLHARRAVPACCRRYLTRWIACSSTSFTIRVTFLAVVRVNGGRPAV